MVRNRYARLIGMLMLSLLASGQVIAQSQEQTGMADVVRTIHTLQLEISALKNRVEALNNLMGIDERVLANVIVLTDQDCAVLGPDWRRYEGMGGRFPLGAGQTKDIREETTSFTLGQDGGAYKHQLTVEEMPKHRHSYRVYHEHRRRCDGDCSARVPHGADTTGEAGGDQPHNNMPPYLVVNFCHKETESRD